MNTYFVNIVLILMITLKASTEITDEEYISIPSVFYVDDFDRCLVLGAKMLYCNVELQLAPGNTNFSKSWSIIKELSSKKKNYRHDLLRHGICVPQFCQIDDKNISIYRDEELLKSDISKCYSDKYKDLGLTGYVRTLHCETINKFYKVDIYDIVVGICLIVLFGIVVLASFYEGLARYKIKEEYDRITKTKFGKVISCFSLPKNWQRLRSTNTNTNLTPLRCMNGIRFYNILLVIMTHTCMIGFATAMSNPRFAETLSDDPVKMLILNGAFAIQTFFLMAGWLLLYNFFLACEGKNNIKPIYIFLAFINRYIRLTPCLLIMIAINGTWLYHYSRGPYWNKIVGEEYRNCRKNWWANLLYINNYYDVKNICMQHSWYLATDTQLFLLCLVIVYVTRKYENYAKLIFSICLTIAILISGLINYIYNYDIVVRQYPEYLYMLSLNLKEFTNVYMPSHTNITGYIVGLIFGYTCYKSRGKKIFTKKSYVALWWILTWTLPLLVIFMGVPFYKDDFEYSRVGAAFYVALGKPIFAFGVGLGIFGITQEVGWFLRDCTIWSPLQVLGRLTYCVYLVHVPIIRVRAGQNRFLFYMSNYSIAVQLCGDIFLSYIFAVLLCLFVELPSSALQKLIMLKLTQKKVNSLKSTTEDTMVNNDNLISKL